MAGSNGFSVRIFIPFGDPEGLCIVEKSNWSGQGLVFPRSLFAEVRKRPELKRTGVYILWGPGEPGQLPRVYVGEGDALLPRLDSHAKNKDFWTQAVVFTSKDQNLNKAHVQYLEARLVALACEAKRCELENGNVPQLPSLSEADAADAEGYLALQRQNRGPVAARGSRPHGPPEFAPRRQSNWPGWLPALLSVGRNHGDGCHYGTYLWARPSKLALWW